MMSSRVYNFHQNPNQPWQYYLDSSRGEFEVLLDHHRANLTTTSQSSASSSSSSSLREVEEGSGIASRGSGSGGSALSEALGK